MQASLFPSGQRGQTCRVALAIGRKMGGKVAQVTDSIVHPSNLTGAEYFDAFVDMEKCFGCRSSHRR
jgi:hypothetical protein